MSYLKYYGLSQDPFSNAPNSRFYFNGPHHAQALLRLTYAVSAMKGLAVLVGDIGAGKTTLARRMLDSLSEDEYEAALLVIIHRGVTAQWLLRRIALQLGVESPSEDKLQLLGQLYRRLVDIHLQNKKAVVLIDEAQMLTTIEVMEEFRGLLNLELPGKKLLSLVFFGLPDLDQNLKLDPPLAQRVAVKYRLIPFSEASTGSYIKHRLRMAGATRMPFSPESVQAAHRFSGGTPRVINTLCDNVLFEGSIARVTTIDGKLVERVAGELSIGPAVTAAAPAVVTSSTEREEIDRYLGLAKW